MKAFEFGFTVLKTGFGDSFFKCMLFEGQDKLDC